MKIMIFGANGQLGGDIVQILKKQYPQHLLIPITHADLDVTDTDGLRQIITKNEPAVVINTTAYHKVDEVEQNPEKAFAVNALAPWRMAQICRAVGAALMFISTDYVFGRHKDRRIPYSENDLPGPINVYGASKMAGEALVQGTWDKHYIVRTSGLYGVRGASGKGGNFVELMLRLAQEGKDIRVVNDQHTTPTYTPDLAFELINLLESGKYGLYHVSNSGECTWYEFASKIFELSGLKPSLTPTTSLEFKTTAARPAYSVLSKEHLAAAGLPPMRSWQDALAEYLKARVSEHPTA